MSTIISRARPRFARIHVQFVLRRPVHLAAPLSVSLPVILFCVSLKHGDPDRLIVILTNTKRREVAFPSSKDEEEPRGFLEPHEPWALNPNPPRLPQQTVAEREERGIR